jgi:hypothetical protein
MGRPKKDTDSPYLAKALVGRQKAFAWGKEQTEAALTKKIRSEIRDLALNDVVLLTKRAIKEIPDSPTDGKQIRSDLTAHVETLEQTYINILDTIARAVENCSRRIPINTCNIKESLLTFANRLDSHDSTQIHQACKSLVVDINATFAQNSSTYTYQDTKTYFEEGYEKGYEAALRNKGTKKSMVPQLEDLDL